ncbi:MAG: serine hydrolase domain-containing protein [Candidatus Heimdallarchaeaceae archaeon]
MSNHEIKSNTHNNVILHNLPSAKIDENGLHIIFDEQYTLNELLNQFNVPGIEITVVNNNSILWQHCAGVKNTTTKQKITCNTIFEAGSTSKIVTAILTMILKEEGVIELDDPIDKTLNSWRHPTDRRIDKITLRQLLSHTAGINRPNSGFSYKRGTYPTINDVLDGKSPAENDPLSLEFEPGSSHQYSNLGYILIQKVIEDASSEDFAKLAKKKIFQKIGMTNSTFSYPYGEDLERMASPHDANGYPQSSGLHPSVLAAGGLVTTGNELAKLMIELCLTYAGKSEKMLKQESVREIFSPQYPLNPDKWFGFTGQGLGCLLKKQNGNTIACQPGTNLPGMVCMFIMDLDEGNGVTIMSNGINGEILHLLILARIQKEYNWRFFVL